MPTPTPPLIARKAQIAAHDGHAACVLGRYTPIDARMNPRPPPRFAGQVAVVLDDGTQVLLYPVWDAQARREAGEITRFKGQRVEVTGKLYAEAPESREGYANLRLPCLRDITAIRLAAEG